MVFSIISTSHILSSLLPKKSPTNWMSIFILINGHAYNYILLLPCTFSIILASELDKIKRKVWWANYLLLYENYWFFLETKIQRNICSITVWTMLCYNINCYDIVHFNLNSYNFVFRFFIVSLIWCFSFLYTHNIFSSYAMWELDLCLSTITCYCQTLGFSHHNFILCLHTHKFSISYLVWDFICVSIYIYNPKSFFLKVRRIVAPNKNYLFFSTKYVALRPSS